MEIKKRNILQQTWIKFMRFLVGYFPLNKIRTMALRQCGFKIGKEVYIGPGLVLSMMNSDNSCELEIGDRVSIGPRVSLILSSDANNSTLNDIFPPIRGKICIANDAWIGAGVIILPNVNIGSRAVLAAGAVVNSSVDENTMVGGVPARVIKKHS
ncbi:MAG: acyltransferase [Bacteroidetes bacterium]|nr:acyltransferase [Bacteroidota bacterium]